MDDEGMWRLFEIDMQRITALDTIAVAIRGWAITLTSALAGFALSADNRRLVIASLVVPALFGLLDVRYRTTQLLHVDRTQQLELFLAPDIPLRPAQRPAASPDAWAASRNRQSPPACDRPGD